MIGTDCSPSVVGASSYESGNRAAALLRRLRSGGALALLVLAVLALAVPSKAQADVLVSNLNQFASSASASTTGYDGAGFGSGGANDIAQGFTTGTNTGGYTLTSIEFAFYGAIDSGDIGDLTASVWTADASGNPDSKLFDLSKPASILRATQGMSRPPQGNTDNDTVTGNFTAFTVPAANTTTTFSMSTTYLVVLTFDDDRDINHTGSDAEDTGAAAGWSIADAGRYKPRGGSWAGVGSSRTFLIRVNGSAVVGTVTNAAPTAANNTVTTAQDTAYEFTAADFGFADTNAGDALASVKIVTLPAAGMLALSGTAVVTDQAVTKADIDGDMLTFTPAADANGAPYTTFTFKVNDGTVDSTRAYTMTVNVTPAPTTCEAPSFGDRREFWSGEVTVGTFDSGGSDAHGFSRRPPAGSLNNSTFDIGENAYTVQGIYVRSDGNLHFSLLRGRLTDHEKGALQLHVCNGHFDFSAASTSVGTTFNWIDDLNWSGETSRMVALSRPLNTVPTGATGTVTTNEDTRHVFAAADFGFADTDAIDSLASVRIVALPAAGTLVLNTTPVTAGDVVTKAELDAQHLRFTPAANASGDAYTTFTFMVSDGFDESATTYTMTVNVTSVNDPATGAPTITVQEGGAVDVGKTLVATGTINDADGVDVDDFSHQWIRVDGVTETDISGETNINYVVTVADEGKQLRVRVSFTDGEGHNESVTSAPTAAVPVPVIPVVTLVLSPASISENGGTSTVTATLGTSSTAATTIQVSAAAVSPAVAADFSLSGTALTIAAGDMTSTGTVTITAVDNNVDAPNKSVTVSGTATNTERITGPDSKTLTITDDDVGSTAVTLSVSPASVPEGAGATTVTVTAELNESARTEVTAVAVSVNAGMATETTDFAAVANFTITIAAGMTSATGTFTLTPANDTIDEPNETVVVRATVSGLSGLSVRPMDGAIVMIADDDDTPQATLELSPASIAENGGASTVTATLDHASSVVTTIEISAPTATDYSLTSNKTLTIAPGATTSTGTVQITARGNTIYTGNKLVTVQGTATNARAIVQPAPQTLTIREDDTASTTITLTAAPGAISEGATGNAQRVTVTAQLNAAARPDATAVTVQVAGDTADEGTDFTAVTEFTITIAAGMTSATGMFTLAPLDDDTDEPEETVRITGTTMASGLSVAPTAGLIVAITDNDDTPQVSLVLTPASISENGGTSTVTATLDRPSSEDTTIAVAAAAGTDTVATDFSLSGTTLTIAAGDMTSTGTVTIAATNNEMIDGAKYVTVSGTVMNTQGSTAPASQTLTIADDDVLATGVILAVSPGSVPESAGATVVTVTATLNGLAGTDPVPVAVSVTGGTAAAATDFGAVIDFMITIPANTKSETGMFTLTPIDDLIDEPDETVQITGTTTASGLTVSPSTMIIEDDDDRPQVVLVLTPASIPENGGSSTVTATLDHPSSEETVVTISAAPVGSADANDFTLSGNRVLRIAVGQTMSAGIVTIEAEDNTTGHPDRVVTVSGSATNGLAIGQPDPASLTITDDEQTSTGFTIAASPMSVSEGATGSARRVTVTATLDAAAREEATVVTLSVRDGTAIAGTDFTEVQDVELTIQPRVTEGMAAFDLIPIDDEIDEPDETVKIVGVSADLGSDTSGGIDVQIEDDDATPQVTLVLAPAAISEDGGSSTVTATLDGRSSEATVITVSAAPVGSADANDFTLNGTTLTIAAGDTTSTGAVTIEAVDNAIDHPDRELTVSGSAANDLAIVQPAAETLTIEDNEVTSTLVTLSISPTNVTEGDGGQTVTVTAELNAAARETDAEVSLKVSELTAKEGVDFTEVPNFTLTIPAGVTTGTAEFTLSVIDDDIDEPVETLEVEGRSLTDDLEVDEMSKDLPMTITDNDDSPQVTLTATPAQIGEDGGTTTIAATLDRPSSDFTTVTVSVTPAANASNADFSVGSNIYLEIRAGDTSSTGDTVTVTAIDNEVDDTGSKTLSVTATVRNDVGFVAPDPLNLPIIDDEAESNNILLEVTPAQVLEGTSATVVTVTASLDGAARAEAVPVEVSVAGGTATAVTDFAAVSDFTITIPANATSETADFTLSPVDDNIDEPDETVLLTGTTTASGLAVGTVSVTITDDDATPQATLVLTPAAISENSDSSTVTATLDRPSTEMTTITVTAAPVSPAVAADFTLSGTTLTIAAGAMSSTGAVTIAANDNETYTGNKSVTISGTAENSQGIEQPTAQALTIEEDDTASMQVTFTVSPEEIQEDDSPQQVTVTAMLDGAARAVDTAAALTVHGVTAVAGTDFTAVSPFTLTILAGATTGTAQFTLTPIDDSTDEPDRTVRVNLPASLPSLTVAPAAGWLEVTIEDDDPTPEAVLVLTPDSIREDGGSTTVTATLDRPSAEATTIEVTATPVSPAVAADFTQSGTTLTIAAGEMSSTGTVTVTARDNTIDHEDREVTVSGVAINALAIVQAPEQTLSITDDEDTSAVVTLTVVSSPDPVAEGESATVTVTATLDKAAREADAVIDVVVSGGTLGQSGRAREGADFSAVTDFAVTIPAGATTGTASFPLITLDDEVRETEETVLVTGTVNSTQTQGPALQVEPAGGVAVAISDDDPEPVVTLVLTPASISENGGSSTVTAELDRPYTGIVTVELTTTPGTGTEADDFILSSSSLTIAAEDVRSSGTAVTIAGVNNILAESSKTVTVAGVANVTDVVQPTAQVLTITDDDTPSTGITLTVSPDRVAEDATTESVTVTAALNGAARSSDTPVIVSVTGGTASAGTDFAAVADFTITIAEGVVSGTNTFTLEPVDDETDAPDRTILVRGQTSAAGLAVVPARGLEVTIVDDDPEPVVTLALAPMEISENGGTSTVTATLDRPSSAAISVDVLAAPVTPAVAEDFRLSSNRVLRFAAGQTASAGTVTVAAVDNDIAADDRQVEVSGTARTDDSRVRVVQPDAVTLTIEDDEQPSTEVTLTVSPGSISEGATGTARQVTVTAELNGAARETVTAVAMTVTAGTATEGEDFAAVSNFTVTIPIGERSGAHTFTLTPFDDVIDEPDETVHLTGGSLSGSGLTLVQPSGGLTVTIEDNEPEPKVTLVLTPDSIREDGGETTVTATLDSPSTEETTITVTATPVAPAVAGDFQLNGATLTIPPGATESTGSVTIEAVNNDVEAPNKRVTVSATAENTFGVGDPPDRTLTITDDEIPSSTVTLSVSPSDIREGNPQTVTVTAELDGAPRTDDTQIAVTVGAGTAAATDFSPVTGFTLTIPAEQKSGTANFTLAPVDDQTDEPDETVVVRGRTSGLTVAPSGGVTVTIADDDDPPEAMLVLTPPSISENGGSSTVTAELNHPSSAQTVVTVTATAQTPAVAGDFRLSGTRLTIPAGQTVSTGRVTLSGVNNELSDGARSVTVSGAAENAQGIMQPTAQTLTITDDDRPSTMVTLTVSPDRVSENGGAKRLTVTGALDGAPESADTVVTLRVNAGAAEAVEAVLTIPMGRRSATAVLILTPVDNAIDDDDDAVVTVVASINNSSLTLDPSSLEVTVTDDDERGVTVSATALTVREGPDGGATYTVVLGSQPTSPVTVTPSVPSQPPGTNLSVSPQSLDFTASNWNEPQTVTVTAAEDDVVEEDAVVELTHMVSGGDYGVNDVAAAAVTVTVLGYEEPADGTVELKVPATGDPVVSVPEGTSTPELAGIEVTLPSGTDTDMVTIRMVDDNHVALRDPPQGFRAGDLVVDIEPSSALSAGQTAQVCLPASSGSQRVHRYDEDATPPEWVELEVPAGGSPQGLACGVTDHFTLFALGSSPGEMVVNSWLSRFGRTVAEQVVDMVTERLQSPREAGTLATLAGHGFGHPVVPPVLDGLPSGTGDARDGDREGWSRSLTGRELLTGMSFTMTGGETAAGSVAVWGRVAHTRFDGRDGAASVDGEVTTMALGMDRASGPWTWGVSLARSEGRGTHGLDDSSNRLRTSLTGLYPFVGYKAGDRLSLWGVAGYGEGDLELTLEGGEPQTTGLKLAMAATGARGELASGGDGFLLSLETDGLFVRTSSGDTADLAASEADASRLRLGLDASWALATESGGRLRPAFEVGLRHDGGDAETGMGVDIGGGIEWADPALGLAVDLHAHGLLAHEAGGFAEQGVSGSVLWDRDRSSERGLEATLSQSLGASGRTGDLLERRTMAGLGQADDGGSTGRLDAKLGYGLAVFGNRFTGTPWIGIGLSGSARDYTLGWRFRPSGGTGLDLGLEASRRETANDNGPEHGIEFRLTARW